MEDNKCGNLPFLTISDLTPGEVKDIRRYYKTGDYTYKDLAKEYFVHNDTIRRIVKKKI